MASVTQSYPGQRPVSLSAILDTAQLALSAVSDTCEGLKNTNIPVNFQKFAKSFLSKNKEVSELCKQFVLENLMTLYL